jgi:transposase
VVQSGSADDVAVVIMDQAGWHVSRRLIVPDNIRILLLPPYSPELNPMENLWHWTKSHYASIRTFAAYDDLLDGVGDAWRSLTRKRLRSLCRCAYLTPSTQP